MMTASDEPTIGPSMNTQKFFQGLLAGFPAAAATAVPRERVGFMEQPSRGMRTEWPKNTARPIARAAKVRLEALLLLTAVSKTARTKRHVNMTSPRKALP